MSCSQLNITRTASRFLALLLAFTITISVFGLQFAQNAAAVTSICPVYANSNLSSDVTIPILGDLDICKWSTASKYGTYYVIDPIETTNYNSCAEWKEEYRAWVAAGSPNSGQPATAGKSISGFEPEVVSLGKDPNVRGNYIVRINFKPILNATNVTPTPTTKPTRKATPTPTTSPAPMQNPNRITIKRPVWPGITATQQALIDRIISVTLEHEKGHQNLHGHLAAAYERQLSVPAKNADEAINSVKSGNTVSQLNLNENYAARDVHKGYDDTTRHGVIQSILGGTDIPEFKCAAIDLTHTRFHSETKTSLDCDSTGAKMGKFDIYNEETNYVPPLSYSAKQNVSESNCGTSTQSEIDIPGLAAVPLEEREYSSTNIYANSFTYPFTNELRSIRHEATTLLPWRYDQREGRLAFSGTVKCQSLLYDTKTLITSNLELYPNSSAFAVYNFKVGAYVGSNAKFKMKLDGTWSSTNYDISLVAVGQGWAEYFNSSSLGTTFEKYIPGGNYELIIPQRCTGHKRNVVESEKNTSVIYDVIIEQ